jgi:hypothetical protein
MATVPCRESNGRSEDARLEHHRRHDEEVIGRDRVVPHGGLSNGLLRQKVPGSGSALCGLRIVGGGHFSSRPPGLATFPPGSRYQGEEGGTDGGATVLTAGGGDACVVGRMVFDSQKARRVQSARLPPSGGLCWASWRHMKGTSFEVAAPGPARIRHAG